MNPEEKLIRKCFNTVEWWSKEVLSKILQRLHHGDWCDRTPLEIFQWCEGEMQELRDEMNALASIEDPNLRNDVLSKIIDECRDVSATAMMLADLVDNELNNEY
jgi:hypothetical protein